MIDEKKVFTFGTYQLEVQKVFMLQKHCISYVMESAGERASNVVRYQSEKGRDKIYDAINAGNIKSNGFALGLYTELRERLKDLAAAETEDND